MVPVLQIVHKVLSQFLLMIYCGKRPPVEFELYSKEIIQIIRALCSIMGGT